MFIMSFILLIGGVIFAAPQFLSQVAYATSATVCDTPCTADTIQAAINAASADETITFGGNATIGHQITINKRITIDGNGYTVSPTFTKTDNGNNAGIGIIGAANVTISNLVVDGASGISLHGINVFESTNVILNSVTLKNNKKYGLVVNNSIVTANDITTANNGWGGINVDKGSPELTIAGTSKQGEIGAIVVEGPSSKVNFVDGKYTEIAPGVYRVTLTAPTSLLPVKGAVTNNNDFSMSWPAVSGAIKYEYQTANTLSNPTTLGTVIYSDDSSSGNYTLGTVITRSNNNAPDNDYYWQVRAGDAFGTWSPWSAINKVTVDTQKPAAPTINHPLDNSIIANIQKVTWSAVTDIFANSVTYIYQSSTNSGTNDSNGSFVSPAYTSSNLSDTQISTLGTPEGTYYLHVKSVDAAGNMSAWSSTVRVEVDNTDPVAFIVTPNEEGVSGHTLNIEGTASDVNFNYYYCYVTNANGEVGIRDSQCTTAWSVGSLFHSAFAATATGTVSGHLGTVDLTGLPSGTYQVHLVAYDKAGNTTESTQAFILDNINPTLTIDTPVGVLSGEDVIFTGTVSEETKSLVLTVDGQDYFPTINGKDWTYNLDTTKLDADTYNVKISAIDLAGNLSDDNAKGSATILTVNLPKPDQPVVDPIAPVALTPTGSPDATNQQDQQATSSNSDTLASVLGAQTTKEDNSDPLDNTAALASTDKGWSIFGLMWYWWVLIAAAVASAWWIISAAIRRRGQDV